MTSYRLLDADLIINLIRTLSLMKQYEENYDEYFLKMCSNNPYILITTKNVESEVNNKIYFKNPNNHDDFFIIQKEQGKKIKRDIFKQIRVIDLKHNKYMKLMQTANLRDIGEISLVVLLSEKYSNKINENTNTVKIISNNRKDVLKFLKKISTLSGNLDSCDLNSLLESNYSFYSNLFSRLQFSNEFKRYFYLTSNIDARLYNKQAFKPLFHSTISR